ncbi:hypothetical protein NDU88_001771 [Pleurodeles waltl]|uniref:Uncharacterized protein n=1 Tax=Pleurodeles waltl TaxID=8319 RepID=A0AAV7SCI8_PLEWA|nr:hypothetical protein NDU88_001771 [Pleurodeles waltl]
MARATPKGLLGPSALPRLVLGAPAPLAPVLRSPPKGMQPERGVANFWGVRLCLFTRAQRRVVLQGR